MASKENSFVVHVKFDVSRDRLESLLDSASRGASYWAQCPELAYASGIREVMTGGYLEIVDREEDDKKHSLTLGKIKKGLKIMAIKEPSSFSDLLEGEADDSTGDTFLQCALFGEVIYG